MCSPGTDVKGGHLQHKPGIFADRSHTVTAEIDPNE